MVTLSLDTSELVAVLRAGRPDDRSGYDRAAMQDVARVVSVIVVQELVRGAASSARPPQRRAQLDRLLSELETVDFTLDDAEAAGELSARLRQAGTPDRTHRHPDRRSGAGAGMDGGDAQCSTFRPS